MEDLGGILILLLIWIVGAAFDQKKKQDRKRRQAQARKERPAPPVEVEPVAVEEPAPARTRRAPLPDATQREGSRLEAVLRQLDPDLAESIGKARRESKRHERAASSRSKSRPAPTPVVMPAPQASELDFMGKAEAAVARRLKVADARVTGRSASDHDRFHDSIRKKTLAPVQVARFNAARLREAIVWREILGPPKAFTLDQE